MHQEKSGNSVQQDYVLLYCGSLKCYLVLCTEECSKASLENRIEAHVLDLNSANGNETFWGKSSPSPFLLGEKCQYRNLLEGFCQPKPKCPKSKCSKPNV
jgi:hypothetical protein